MDEKRVGLLGATSLVGECLLPLMTKSGWRAVTFSRQARKSDDVDIEWRRIDPHPSPIDSGSELRSTSSIPGVTPEGEDRIECWICVAPIWVLPDYFDLLAAYGAQRVVALSSTSRFTKDDSTDTEEQAIALRLADAEMRVREWAESRGVEWVILRPTLIYGLGRDKNITEIVRFIRRFGFFPLFGKAKGLRQPVHAADVAGACLAALQTPAAANRAYNISGGETLTYRDMVGRIFSVLGHRARLLTVPLWAFHLAVTVLRRLPRYRQWSTAMAERMNRDLVFEHKEAENDLGFSPRPFLLESRDLP